MSEGKAHMQPPCQSSSWRWSSSNMVVVQQGTAQGVLAPPSTSWTGHSVCGAVHLRDESLPSPWGTEDLGSVSLTRNVEGCVKKIQGMGIHLKNIEGVHEYLLRFPGMIGATMRIAEVVLTHLPDAQLALEVYQDPEIEDSHLVLYARFKEYDQTTMARIREARRECRRYLIARKGWFQLTTDFQPTE